MTSIPKASFSSPSSPGDAIAVLVLVETSATMMDYWDDVKKFYLPTLLDTLRLNNPSVSMRICWQMTTETQTNQSPSGALPSNSANSNEIPDITIDPSSCNAISTDSLRYSIETLKAAFRERRATRHLFIVAASSSSESSSSPLSRNGHEPWRAIAYSLSQEKIRLHLILGISHNTQPFRDLHEQSIRLQNSLVVPAWFNVDTSRFLVLLSGVPHSFPGPVSDSGLSARAMLPIAQSSPATPSTSTSSLPSSPTYEGSAPAHQSQVSPQNRRGKHRASGSASPAAIVGPPTHGLVSYLQQMHGLTKKRSYGQKANKRASSGDITRPTASSRPILPRLDLPDSRLRAWPYPTTTSPPNRALLEKAASGVSRYTSIAPAPFDNASVSDDGRRSRRSWPWISPDPLASTSTDRSSALSSNPALQSLASMTPRLPDIAPRNSDTTSTRQPVHPRDTSTMTSPSTYPAFFPHTQSQMPEWHPGGINQHSFDPPMSSTPSPTTLTSSSHLRGPWRSPNLPSQYHVQPVQSPPIHYNPQPRPVFQSPLTSPAISSEDPNDPENQPFVITPEYEALANAQFEAAVRSGAMQASMTATTLSPLAASPLSTTNSDYFVGTSSSSDSRLHSSLTHQLSEVTQPQQQLSYPYSGSYANYHPAQPVSSIPEGPSNHPHRSYPWYGPA